MSVLQKLTEGIVNRDLGKEGAALLSKWERTGLLEGLGDHSRTTMARLLENQAKELLREASTMAGGDVEGFASVAFPIVRRVFGGLIANDLVSVQPMSLPSGLIFFLDFTYTGRAETSGVHGDRWRPGDSLFGGGVVGQQITGGVEISSGSRGDDGFYNLSQGYSSPIHTGSVNLTLQRVTSGVLGSTAADVEFTRPGLGGGGITTSINKLCRYDPDLSGSTVSIYAATASANMQYDATSPMNWDNLIALALDHDADGTAGSTSVDLTECRQIRRLNQLVGIAEDLSVPALLTKAATAKAFIFVFEHVGNRTDAQVTTELNTVAKRTRYPLKDNLDNVGERSLGAVVGADMWGLEFESTIPEIDIKVDSVAITAKTKKLKAKWTPELGQDLNAYHNLDAEVELTGILSEQIALEIDREIVNDLVQGASAGTYYWSRAPGLFVNRLTGMEVGHASAAPDFTGTVSEWYETLVETINDVSAQIHRKTLRGGANFLVCGPEVANILEFTSGFRANITGDADKGTVGAVNAGSISKKWDVWVDPYFPRNVILVGRRGNSFLESGYVYAPYVPLQTTPTIFGTEDFVPRKGDMTRYGKKMVRPDMYGLVIVRGLLGEAGKQS